jgi:hypothetical protein
MIAASQYKMEALAGVQGGHHDRARDVLPREAPERFDEQDRLLVTDGVRAARACRLDIELLEDLHRQRQVAPGQDVVSAFGLVLLSRIAKDRAEQDAGVSEPHDRASRRGSAGRRRGTGGSRLDLAPQRLDPGELIHPSGQLLKAGDQRGLRRCAKPPGTARTRPVIFPPGQSLASGGRRLEPGPATSAASARWRSPHRSAPGWRYGTGRPVRACGPS